MFEQVFTLSVKMEGGNTDIYGEALPILIESILKVVKLRIRIVTKST
jgi:hypothetical protein